MTAATLPHDLAEAADRLERLARRLGEDHGPLVRRLRDHAAAVQRQPPRRGTKSDLAALRALHERRRAIKAKIESERAAK